MKVNESNPLFKSKLGWYIFGTHPSFMIIEPGS